MSAVDVKNETESTRASARRETNGERSTGASVPAATPAAPAPGTTTVHGPFSAVPSPPEDVNKAARKVAIVGYTTSKEEAPYDDPAWEKWGMNNLHLADGFPTDKCTRWYNLHDLSKIDNPESDGGDPAHATWLRQPHPFPIFIMDPLDGITADPEGNEVPSLAERTGIPSAVPFPKRQILSQFAPYFTNTVSWQIGHLVLEAMSDDDVVLTDLALYGIDMAVGTEYAAQRPSVEFFLGLVQGLGVLVHLPPSSDLLKAAELYGGEDENSGLRAKVAQRLRELHEQKASLEQQMANGQQMLASVCGAIDSFSYIQGVWVPPSASPGARDAVKPFSDHSVVGELLAKSDAKDRHAKE